MTYTPNVPQGNQQISTTQPYILGNFGYIDTAMKVNHTWNGNAVSTEAPGSHQRLDMPNRATDIAVLPTGIDAVMYAKDGNLFSYNGAKCPVSGVAISGTITLTTTLQTIATLPNECNGYVTIWTGTAKNSASLAFFMVGGVGYVQQIQQSIGTQPPVAIAISGSALQIGVITGSSIPNAPYKIIYWPV